MKNGRLMSGQASRSVCASAASSPGNRCRLGVTSIQRDRSPLAAHHPDGAKCPFWVRARAVMIRPMCEPASGWLPANRLRSGS